MNPSKHGGLLYADEASFGEAVTVFDEALAVVGEIDLTGLTHDKESLNPLVQFPNAGVHDMRLTQGGTFSVKLWLTGHGSAVAAGALTANQLETFLGRVIGNMTAAQVGTTAVAAGSDADTLVVADGTGILNSGMIRVGALGDGDGEGQFYAVNTEAANAAELLNAMLDTPADGAVVYAPVLVHPSESVAGSTVTSLRFEALTANMHARIHGCIAIGEPTWEGFGPGGRPSVTVTFGVSRWSPVNSTFPHAVSVDRIAPSNVTAGSLFLQDYGTTTRQVYSVREFNFGTFYESALVPGPGSGNEFQLFTEGRLDRVAARCDFVLDAEATGTYTHGDRWNDSELDVNYEHLLYTMSCGRDGASLGLYLRKAKFVGQRPKQFSMDNRNRQRLHYEAITDESGSNDITRSNFMIAFA